MSSPYPDSTLWPAGWPSATFEGRLIDIGAEPGAASITLRPAVPFGLADDAGTLVIASDILIPTWSGEWSVSIPATGVAGITPAGWQWLVTITPTKPGLVQTFLMDAPAGSTVSLTDVVALGPAPAPSGLAITEALIRSVVEQMITAGAGIIVSTENGVITISATGGGSSTTVTLTQDPEDSGAWLVSGASLTQAPDDSGAYTTTSTLTQDPLDPGAYVFS